MLYALTSLFLVVAPVASLDHDFHPLSAANRARRAVAAKPTTFNCDIVSCGAATGGLRQATKFCASYMGSPVVTRTVFSGSTTVPYVCPPPTTTSTSTPFPEPYCLHRAYPKSEICSCLSIPSDYTVYITNTETATYTGPFGVNFGTSNPLRASPSPSATSILVLNEGGGDQFAVRQDGALVDLSLANSNNAHPFAYQLPGEGGGGQVLFDPSDPSDPPTSSDVALNCHIFNAFPSGQPFCQLACSGVEGNAPYVCPNGLYLTAFDKAPAADCAGPSGLFPE